MQSKQHQYYYSLTVKGLSEKYWFKKDHNSIVNYIVNLYFNPKFYIFNLNYISQKCLGFKNNKH